MAKTNTLKQKIISEIQAQFACYTPIHSIHLIGSHTDKYKPFDRINDLDILCLTKKEFNASIYQEITEKLKKVAQKYTTDNIYIGIETRHANIKLKPQKNEHTTIQLHQLTFDFKNFKNAVLKGNLALHNWVIGAKPIVGENLESLIELPLISKKFLSHERDSIDFMLKAMDSDYNTAVVHTKKNDELIIETQNIKMDKYDKLELCHTAVKEICGTLLKYFNQKNKIYSEQQRIKFIKNNIGYQAVILYEDLSRIKQETRNLIFKDYNERYYVEYTKGVLRKLENLYS